MIDAENEGWRLLECREGPDVVTENDNKEVVAWVGGYTNSTRRNRARLIAAAPDLLAVVEEILHSCDMWGQWDVPDGIVDRAKSAVAKAKGGTE